MVVAAMAIAVVANAFRGPKRQLKLPGWYPNAMTAPRRAAAAPVAAVAPATTTEPLPVTPSATVVETPATTTIIAPPTATTTTQPPPAATATAPPTPAPQPAKVDLTRFAPHPDKAFVEISGDDAAALHRAGTLFLDARRSEIFEEGHIPGARSFSVWEADVDDKVTALYEQRQDDQNKAIVIYCSGGACEDSHMLAQKLWAVQFNNVYVYKDGFPDWQKRGLPVNKGVNP